MKRICICLLIMLGISASIFGAVPVPTIIQTWYVPIGALYHSAVMPTPISDEYVDLFKYHITFDGSPSDPFEMYFYVDTAIVNAQASKVPTPPDTFYPITMTGPGTEVHNRVSITITSTGFYNYQYIEIPFMQLSGIGYPPGIYNNNLVMADNMGAPVETVVLPIYIGTPTITPTITVTPFAELLLTTNSPYYVNYGDTINFWINAHLVGNFPGTSALAYNQPTELPTPVLSPSPLFYGGNYLFFIDYVGLNGDIYRQVTGTVQANMVGDITLYAAYFYGITDTKYLTFYVYSPTASITPTYTEVNTYTNTPTITSTKTITPTFTRTSTITVSPTLTITKTITKTRTVTATKTLTPKTTASISATITPLKTKTFLPTRTFTRTPGYTSTRTPVVSPTATRVFEGDYPHLFWNAVAFDNLGDTFTAMQFYYKAVTSIAGYSERYQDRQHTYYMAGMCLINKFKSLTNYDVTTVAIANNFDPVAKATAEHNFAVAMSTPLPLLPDADINMALAIGVTVATQDKADIPRQRYFIKSVATYVATH